MSILKTTVGILAALASTSSIALADWPAFRGPQRDGILRGQSIPLKWSATENVLWRTELPGQGWSSPVVSGQKVYLTAAVPQSGSDGGSGATAFDLNLITLDANTGSMLDTRTVLVQSTDAPRIHSKNSHASPTPIIQGDRIYLHFGHLGTACLTLEGETIWKNESLSYSPVHGNGGSPALAGDLLIFSRDGKDTAVVTALDKHTGKVVWETTRDVEASRKFSFCTPLLATLGGREQLILPGSNVVQSLDPVDGSELWRVRYDGYSVIPRPIVDSGLVFVATGYNRPSLLAIDPTGSGDVTETHLKWKEKTSVPHTPSLIALGGSVAMVSDKGIASCLDSSSGDLKWKLRVGGNFSASPVLYGTRLLLQDEQGVCSVIDLSAANPEILHTNELGERTLASFAVYENTLLLRSDKALYRISE
ncbi:MAG TPA: serine/threonine protein kinase [Planctomycetaceae bacterium]|nr:serine/threonine protein kinase [Planctomycetaceae bacterium]